MLLLDVTHLDVTVDAMDRDDITQDDVIHPSKPMLAQETAPLTSPFLQCCSPSDSPKRKKDGKRQKCRFLELLSLATPFLPRTEVQEPSCVHVSYWNSSVFPHLTLCEAFQLEQGGPVKTPFLPFLPHSLGAAVLKRYLSWFSMPILLPPLKTLHRAHLCEARSGT